MTRRFELVDRAECGRLLDQPHEPVHRPFVVVDPQVDRRPVPDPDGRRLAAAAVAARLVARDERAHEPDREGGPEPASYASAIASTTCAPASKLPCTAYDRPHIPPAHGMQREPVYEATRPGVDDPELPFGATGSPCVSVWTTLAAECPASSSATPSQP